MPWVIILICAVTIEPADCTVLNAEHAFTWPVHEQIECSTPAPAPPGRYATVHCFYWPNEMGDAG
jgi:hypothetical protein